MCYMKGKNWILYGMRNIFFYYHNSCSVHLSHSKNICEVNNWIRTYINSIAWKIKSIDRYSILDPFQLRYYCEDLAMYQVNNSNFVLGMTVYFFFSFFIFLSLSDRRKTLLLSSRICLVNILRYRKKFLTKSFDWNVTISYSL